MGGNERFFHAIDCHGKRFQETPLGRDNFYSFAKLYALMVGYPMCWTFGVCEIFCQTIFIFRISFFFPFLGSYLEKIRSYWPRRFRNVGHFRCRYEIFVLMSVFCLIFNLLSEIVNHADIKTTRKYLAKSIRTHQQVAEGLFGSNENTRALTNKKPMGQVQNVACDVPSRIKDTLLNSSDLAVRYRCIIAAARYKEDNEVDLSDYCRPELTEKSNLPNRTLQNIWFI